MVWSSLASRLTSKGYKTSFKMHSTDFSKYEVKLIQVHMYTQAHTDEESAHIYMQTLHQTLPPFEHQRDSDRPGERKIMRVLHSDTIEGYTYVSVSPLRAVKTRALRSSKVSWANCGSSFTSILYRETSMVKIAMPSVSKNLSKKGIFRP